MKNLIHLEGNDLYLSKRYLKEFTSPKTIECWNEAAGIVKIKIDAESFFLYKSIPYRTRKKLLPIDRIISQESRNSTHSKITELFHEAFYYKYSKYSSIYREVPTFTTEQVTKFSKIHAVFQVIIELKQNNSFHQLSILHDVWKGFFPGKLQTKQAFSNAILKALKEGVMSAALDKRAFGNNDRSKRENTKQVDYIIASLVASGDKFTNPVMLDKANSYFKENGLKEMSLSWMKKQRREWLKNPVVYKNRYGELEANKKMPFASMKHAPVVLKQVLIDGIDIPFLEKRDDNRLHHPTLVYVIDNCSKKIIGYSIGDNENGVLIKEAIRKSIYNTQVFPNEIVMDNHSFTQTKAALYFEDYMNKIGAKVTKTSNPQHKSIVERYSQYLHALFNNYPGYTGPGNDSKSIDKKISKEKFTKAAQKPSTRSEIIAITVKVIEDYNNKPQRGKTPNQVFCENPNPYPILPTQFELAELLPYREEKQIRRNQITIQRGYDKFEYQLPADLYEEWNDQIVIITYDDLNEGIFMYDRKTGKGIKKLFLKEKINNAKAEQTDIDRIALYKNSGRIKGIKHAGKYKLEKLTIDVHEKDPQIGIKLSPLLMQKNIIKEYQADSNTKLIAEENGVIINELHIIEPYIDIPSALKPKKKDTNPFKITGNHLKKIDPSEDIEDE